MHARSDEIRARAGSTISFRISEAMVAAFAELTGDRSPNHISPADARLSAYRQPIVHGMLPIGFIAPLDCLQIKGLRCVPIGATGHFNAPVYPGDRLTLSAEPRQRREEKSAQIFDYHIENEASGNTVTRGTVTVKYDNEPASPRRAPSANGGQMLVSSLEIQKFRLEDLKNGQKEGFDFRITEVALENFISILAAGTACAQELDQTALRNRFHLPNLLSLLLFSTSVGICLPGASATFLEFTGQATGEVALETVYRLNGEVTHLSRATRLVRKKLTISPAHDKDTAVFCGTAATLVNEPSRRMPAIRDLKASALDFGVRGKIVLVTGASRGIGETTAKLFAMMGAKVVVNYHRGAEDAARVVKEITGDGGDAIAAPANVTRREEVGSLVKRAVETYGTIHILVNNAVGDYRPVPFLELTWDQIQAEVDVTVKGAFNCCREVVPLMLAAGAGKIINISSAAVDNPPPRQSKYVLAKSALVGLTRSLSIEFASSNIQVNMVVPNFVDTDLVAHIPEGFRTKIAQATPMERNASPIDVAQAVIFLASSYSSFTTGQKFMVTGGGVPYL